MIDSSSNSSTSNQDDQDFKKTIKRNGQTSRSPDSNGSNIELADSIGNEDLPKIEDHIGEVGDGGSK